ncbi:MAG: hypothetical protein WC686_00445 [Candidatus Shapirobacteria bacterium]|jgi:hypothetical protein
MKLLLKIFLIFLLLLIIIPVAALAYLGFIPSLSPLFGADKPKSLNVSYTPADLDSAKQKNGVIMTELSTTSESTYETIRYSGTKNVSASLSSAEITALANSPTWKYFPVSSIQIKLNPDGSAEASGILLLDRLPGYLSVLGISAKDIQSAANYLKIKGNTPFYFKGVASVTDNKVSLNTHHLEIGRFSVPTQIIKDNQKYLVSLAEIRIKSVPGLSVKSFSTQNGQLSFDGTMPSAISWEK